MGAQALSTSTTSVSRKEKHLVLVGGGHAHAQVIKALKARSQNLHVTLIDAQTTASYSGMVPGCVAKLYTPEQTLLHLQPLCEWANIDFIQDEVVDMDLEKQCITLKNQKLHGAISYDAVSLDIGSKSRGLEDVPGAWEYTIPTRPISKLVERIDAAEKELLSEGINMNAHVVVVGGGAAGIELAMSMRGRWNPLFPSDSKNELKVTLLDAGGTLLPNETVPNQEALKTVLKDRHIEVLHNCHVEEITESHVVLKQGSDGASEIAYTHCIWAAGAAAHPLADRLNSRGLAVNHHGWIRVNDRLQSVSHPDIFAAGDCCTIEDLPGGKTSPPKAGVYAVRSGPVLIENLTNFFAVQDKEKPLIRYDPQDDFLKLLSLGDGTALGFRFGIPLYGKWVFEMKDHIDQLFMNLFKKENLPTDTPTGDEPDKSDFDALDEDEERVRLSPEDAAVLLQRSDDKVDYMTAWLTIRDMTKDDDYRKTVLNSVKGIE